MNPYPGCGKPIRMAERVDNTTWPFRFFDWSRTHTVEQAACTGIHVASRCGDNARSDTRVVCG
jgi:hypothetical protein